MQYDASTVKMAMSLKIKLKGRFKWKC